MAKEDYQNFDRIKPSLGTSGYTYSWNNSITIKKFFYTIVFGISKY